MELRDYEITKHYSGVYIVTGKIYNDNKGRFKDGDFVRSSTLESIDFKNMIAKTKNSTYILKGENK